MMCQMNTPQLTLVYLLYNNVEVGVRWCRMNQRASSKGEGELDIECVLGASESYHNSF